MDYTREPIVETVITPKDGYRIAIRSSKNPGQEEFTVEALEVVSFGANCFFRCLERPKAFMVPASDYEVLEVRETRVSLKAASPVGIVKLPSTRESPRASPRDIEKRKPVPPPKEPVVTLVEPEKAHVEVEPVEEVSAPLSASEGRPERRNDRRRGPRRRRGGREEIGTEETRPVSRKSDVSDVSISSVLEPTSPLADLATTSEIQGGSVPPVLTTILPPPSTLIRDDIERLRRSEQYRGAFYIRETEEVVKETADDDAPIVPRSLQEDEPSVRPQEENTYKATPAPLDG